MRRPRPCLRHLALTATLTALTALTAGTARAEVPGTIAFAANLDEGGVPMNGAHDFDFELFLINPTSGVETSVWAESQGAIPVVDGFVDLELGSITALVGSIALDKVPLFLQVSVDGTPLLPRVKVTSAPYALRAGDAETLGGAPPQAFFKLGTIFLCGAGQQMMGINTATGNVVCGADAGGGGGGTTYSAGAGLQLVGTVFSIATGGVGGSHLAANSVFSAKIVNESILGEDILNGTITSADLADGTIAGNDLAADSVSTTTIVDGTIAGEDIQGNAIAAVHIQAGAVGTSELAAGAVTSSKLAVGAIGGTAIADSSITAADIASGAVTTLEIQDTTILGVDIAPGAIKTPHVDLPMGRGSCTLTYADVQAGNDYCSPVPTVPLPQGATCVAHFDFNYGGYMQVGSATGTTWSGLADGHSQCTTETGDLIRYNYSWEGLIDPGPGGPVTEHLYNGKAPSASCTTMTPATGQDLHVLCSASLGILSGSPPPNDPQVTCPVTYFRQ